MSSTFAKAAGLAAATGLVVSGALVVAPGAVAMASETADISWGPVTTVWNGHPQSEVSLTTDNGMVVAAWIGPHFNGAYVAVRPDGGYWSKPRRVSDDAATVQLAKDGAGAWVAWQGFDHVEALQVDPNGSFGATHVVGDSSDPFVGELGIAVGANGSVAVAYGLRPNHPPMLGYRSQDGSWQPPE